MLVAFTDEGWEDYCFWQETDPKTALRINALLKDAKRHPFSGIGKPEPLKGQFKGFWSRRLAREHRLVYMVKGTESDQVLIVAQCRYHY